MPLVMQLEGLNRGHLAEIRTRLNTGGQARLNGLFDPITSRPLVVAGGVLIGMWLAGSAAGRGIVKRVVKR